MNTVQSVGFRSNGFIVARLLVRAQAILIIERFGQVDPQGMNKSITRRYRRLEALPLAIAPIAEGVAPAGQALIITNIEVTLEQFADAVPFTDVLADTIEDNTLDDMAKLVAQQAAETKEIVRFKTLCGGSNVFYAGGTTRTGVSATVSRSLFRKIYRSLKRNRAQFIGDIIAATPHIATEPVGQAYFAIGHTDLDADIKDCAGFTPVEKYSNSTKALPGEIGKVENMRFILSDLFTPWLSAATDNASQTTFLTGGGTGTGSADVYPILIFGENAYGIVPLQGKNSVKIYIVNPTATASDPVAQKGSVGWKMMDGTVILNDLWMARAEVAASQTPS